LLLGELVENLKPCIGLVSVFVLYLLTMFEGLLSDFLFAFEGDFPLSPIGLFLLSY